MLFQNEPETLITKCNEVQCSTGGQNRKLLKNVHDLLKRMVEITKWKEWKGKRRQARRPWKFSNPYPTHIVQKYTGNGNTGQCTACFKSILFCGDKIEIVIFSAQKGSTTQKKQQKTVKIKQKVQFCNTNPNIAQISENLARTYVPESLAFRNSVLCSALVVLKCSVE